MNKIDFVRMLAAQSNLPINKTEEVVKNFMEIIITTVAEGEEILFVGFGKFTSVEKKECVKKNPRTGESLTIPAKKVPRFTAGKVFKERVQRTGSRAIILAE